MLSGGGAGQNIYVSDQFETSGVEISRKDRIVNKQLTPMPHRATLATLDRRPNRPSFHHLGPPPGSHMPGPPYLNRPQIGKRMGGVLQNVQEMITLAKSEVGVLRDLAKNITESGKELNLWEVMDAVNTTVSDNPNSGIAKLMRR